MPPAGKIRVLVVDDSALMRQFISDILKSDPRNIAEKLMTNELDEMIKVFLKGKSKLYNLNQS